MRKSRGKRSRAGDGSYTVSSKAANGEGSLYREADGAWRATYRVPGESRPRRVRGRTRDEALRRRGEALTTALAEQSRSVSATSLTSASTVAEVSSWWLHNIAAVRVRASSLGKYVDRVERITAHLGDVRIGSLRVEQIARWQATLLESLSPKTVADTRATLRSVVAEAVNLDLVSTNPVDRVRPPKARAASKRALTAAEARALVGAGARDRLGAAIALLFVQGWRVSEVLGLAWGDVDLAAGTATVSRACVYADGIGMMLGPPKTEGAAGQHLLTPVVVELLHRRHAAQLEERQRAGDAWRSHTYAGRAVDLVFTTMTGGLLLRQAVTKAIAASATTTGIDPTGLGTHAGRSTAITVLYAEEGLDLADIARHVGHAVPPPPAAMSATSAAARPRPQTPHGGCWTLVRFRICQRDDAVRTARLRLGDARGDLPDRRRVLNQRNVNVALPAMAVTSAERYPPALSDTPVSARSVCVRPGAVAPITGITRCQSLRRGRSRGRDRSVDRCSRVASPSSRCSRLIVRSGVLADSRGEGACHLGGVTGAHRIGIGRWRRRGVDPRVAVCAIATGSPGPTWLGPRGLRGSRGYRGISESEVFVTIGRSSRVRPATIYDVAEAAGVSHQTVSRLLRGFKGIRPETRARVETAIAELQYRPNPAARSLKNGRTHRIGALTHDLTEVGPSKTIDGASHGAHDAGYLLDVVSIDPRDPHAIEQAIQILRQQELAGVMVFAAADAVAAAVEPAGFAVPVVVDAELDEAQYATPATLNGRGSEMLVEHLFRLGHRNLLYVAGPRDWISARNRVVAYSRALKARGLISGGVLEGDWSAASGYTAGHRIPLDGSVTAVLAGNDQMALGVIRAVTERGIRVPDDMSVVGFDDIPEAAYFRPSLTTVSVDIDRGGRAAIARLIAQIEGRDAAPDLNDPGPHLRVRESSGTAPR